MKVNLMAWYVLPAVCLITAVCATFAAWVILGLCAISGQAERDTDQLAGVVRDR